MAFGRSPNQPTRDRVSGETYSERSRPTTRKLTIPALTKLGLIPAPKTHEILLIFGLMRVALPVRNMSARVRSRVSWDGSVHTGALATTSSGLGGKHNVAAATPSTPVDQPKSIRELWGGRTRNCYHSGLPRRVPPPRYALGLISRRTRAAGGWGASGVWIA
jgi:hypothetical protein